MKTALRRILGILVMIAGILGLILAIAGIIGVWMAKPAVGQGLETTIATLNSSIDTSQQAMVITEQALQGTIDSVAALQVMLAATAQSVEDTKPMLDLITGFLGNQLPNTISAASSSLSTAQKGAEALDGAITAFDTFRSVLTAVPLIGGFIPPTTTAPRSSADKSLAESLGEVATELEDLPAMFTEMSKSLDNADNNLVTVQTSLVSMADSVGTITTSLEGYKTMVANSQGSMENLKGILTDFQANLGNILNTVAIVITVFLLWLLMAQVVILSQGYELYHGTVGRMEGRPVEEPVDEKAAESVEKTGE
jgi:peptidoglycan hydrolase CwlO-like protein